MINIAKYDSAVQEEILLEYGISSSATPNYYSTSATRKSDDSWSVTLSGSVYGYNNRGTSLGGSFTAYVAVDASGLIITISVYRN